MSNAPAPTKRRRQLHTRGNVSTSSSRDASEEDNDDLTDDTQSILSLNTPTKPTFPSSSPNSTRASAHPYPHGPNAGFHATGSAGGLGQGQGQGMGAGPSPLSGVAGAGGGAGRALGGAVKRRGSHNTNTNANEQTTSPNQAQPSSTFPPTFNQHDHAPQTSSDQTQQQPQNIEARERERDKAFTAAKLTGNEGGDGGRGDGQGDGEKGQAGQMRSETQGSGSEGGGETDPTYDADGEVTKPGNSLALAAQQHQQQQQQQHSSHPHPPPLGHISHLSSESTDSTEDGGSSPGLTPGQGRANIAASNANVGGGAGVGVGRAVTPTPGLGYTHPDHVGVGMDPPPVASSAQHALGGFKVPSLPHPPPASALTLSPVTASLQHGQFRSADSSATSSPVIPHRSAGTSGFKTLKPKSSDLGPPKMMTRPKMIEVDDIRQWVRRAIEGRGNEDGIERTWRTNEPPVGRKVRIYADGVYDLFHFGHALQLRQAKLSFENVHLIVGVNSDAQCAAHKNAPSMTHAERMESVSNCRWADEIAADAPWIVTQDFLDRYEIDYVAHDEEVYPGAGVEDVYAFAKKQGKFIPTRRTPSISTSDLLERIVRGYRDGFFDSKLIKNNAPELIASDVDWDSSGEFERRGAREKRNALRVAASAIGRVESDSD